MASQLTHTFTQWRSHCMGIFFSIPMVRRVVTAGLGAWPGRGLLSGVVEVLSVHLGSGSNGTYRGKNASTYALHTCLFYLIRLKIAIIIEAHCKDIDQKFTNTCTPTPPLPRQDCWEQTLFCALWHHTRFLGSVQKVCKHHIGASPLGGLHLWP